MRKIKQNTEGVSKLHAKQINYANTNETNIKTNKTNLDIKV
jgi:hypothetical protein